MNPDIITHKYLIDTRNEIINFLVDKISRKISDMEKYDKIYLTSVNEIRDTFKFSKYIISFLLNGRITDPEFIHLNHKLKDFDIQSIKYILFTHQIPRLRKINKIHKKMSLDIAYKNDNILLSLISVKYYKDAKYEEILKKFSYVKDVNDRLIKDNQVFGEQNTQLIRDNKSLVEKNNHLIKDNQVFGEQNTQLIKDNQLLTEQNKFLKNAIENSINSNIQKISKYENILFVKNDKIHELENEIKMLREALNPPLPKSLLSSPPLPLCENFDVKNFLHNTIYESYNNYT